MVMGLPKRLRVHGLRSEWKCIDALNLDGPVSCGKYTQDSNESNDPDPDTDPGSDPIVVHR
eukprot:8789268-Karenia_brevis.AAC.1